MRNKYRYSRNIRCKDCKKTITNDAIRCRKCYGIWLSKYWVRYWNKKGRKIYTKVCKICNKLLSQTSQYMKERKYCRLCAKLSEINKDYNKYKKYLDKVSDIFIAWLTGFYEGEGNLGFFKDRLQYLAITQKEKNPLIKIKNNLKIGNVNYSRTPKSGVNKWAVSRQGYIIALLERMLPYMKSKNRYNKSIGEIKKYHERNKKLC
jgi:hypothetical protein